MPRNTPNRETAFPKAARSSKSLGEQHNNSASTNNASGCADGTSTLPDLKTLTKAIGECRQLAKSARRQIEILVTQNVHLQNELAELGQKELQARQLAYHDVLTGLPNRNLLQDRFHQAMFQAERNRKPLALLMLDLDDFKRVNDQLGHISGDKLLQAVAHRLTKGIRGADTACRYGGDEFVIMLPEINSPNSAAALAGEIGGRLGEPYIIDGHQIHMAVSIGVAVYPGDGRTFDDLMKQADSAMYRSKGTGHPTAITAQPKQESGAPALSGLASFNPVDCMRERNLFIQDEALHLAEPAKH